MPTPLRRNTNRLTNATTMFFKPIVIITTTYTCLHTSLYTYTSSHTRCSQQIKVQQSQLQPSETSPHNTIPNGANVISTTKSKPVHSTSPGASANVMASPRPGAAASSNGIVTGTLLSSPRTPSSQQVREWTRSQYNDEITDTAGSGGNHASPSSSPSISRGNLFNFHDQDDIEEPSNHDKNSYSHRSDQYSSSSSSSFPSHQHPHNENHVVSNKKDSKQLNGSSVVVTGTLINPPPIASTSPSFNTSSKGKGKISSSDIPSSAIGMTPVTGTLITPPSLNPPAIPLSTVMNDTTTNGHLSSSQAPNLSSNHISVSTSPPLTSAFTTNEVMLPPDSYDTPKKSYNNTTNY